MCHNRSVDTPDTADISSETIRTIIEKLSDGLLLLTDEGRIVFINKKAAEMLRIDHDSAVGQKLSKMADDSRATALKKFLMKGQQEGREGLERAELNLGSDTYFEISTSKMNSGSEPRAGDYQLVTLHDISHEKMVEEMKLEFASVAAHQMRTPLSAIRWSFEVLSKELGNEDQKKIARRGYRSTQRILEIVNGLLNLDRLEAGKSAYTFKPVDVVELIVDYLDEVKKNSSILNQPEIVFKEPLDPIPKVRADKEKLLVALRNLVENALKYTPEDGSVEVQTSVHVTSNYAGDVVQIMVRDTGIGIPKEARDKVFSKFYRADNATAKETDGTGIGLFITKRIIEEHHGKIWFETEEDEGTTFFVQLPIARSQD